MTNIIQATGATRLSLVNIIKRQMIETVIESGVDPANQERVRSVLAKANFGKPAIEALAAEVSLTALEETGAVGAK